MTERADFVGCTMEERLAIVALEELRAGHPLIGFDVSPTDWSVLLRFLDGTKRSGFRVYTTPEHEVVIVTPLMGREVTVHAWDAVADGDVRPRGTR